VRAVGNILNTNCTPLNQMRLVNSSLRKFLLSFSLVVPTFLGKGNKRKRLGDFPDETENPRAGETPCYFYLMTNIKKLSFITATVVVPTLIGLAYSWWNTVLGRR
jgi:hypothetical protein